MLVIEDYKKKIQYPTVDEVSMLNIRKILPDRCGMSTDRHLRRKTILFLILFLCGCMIGNLNLYYAKNGILTDHIAFSESDPSILIGVHEKYRYSQTQDSKNSTHNYNFKDTSITIEFLENEENRFQEYVNLHEGEYFGENGSKKFSIQKNTVNHAGIDFVCVTSVSKIGEQSFLTKEMVRQTSINNLLLMRFQKKIEDRDYSILIDTNKEYLKYHDLIHHFNKECNNDIKIAKSEPNYIKTLKIAVSEGKKITPLEFNKYFNHVLLSTPDTAKVFIDGELKGITPAVVSLREGLHKIRIEKEGYEPYESESDVDEHTPKSEVTLKPVKQSEPTRKTREYALFVNVTPPDADIKITNIIPKFQQGILLKKGTYKLKIDKIGYETIFETVRITDSDVRLSFQLTALTKPEESMIQDQMVPTITVDEVSFKSQNSPSKQITIKVADDSGIETLTVNGEEVKIDSNGVFKGEIMLPSGSNRVRIVATDKYQNKAVKIISVE